MENKKILSISIAAYNVESTLRECLDPFLDSSVMDVLDVMIVDDGSKDNTAKIALEYQDRYPDTFRLISKENGGWGSTVNTGIVNAKGKFFRQLDGDDYYKPENMYDYIQFLSDCDADMIIAPYIEYNGETGETMSEPNCNPGYETAKVFHLSEINNFQPFMHSMTIKTELIRDKVKITEKCFYTDTEFVLKSCNMAETIAFFDKPIYCYRRGTTGQSMSLNGMEKHYMDQTKVISVLLDYLKDEVKRPEVEKIYNNLLLGTCCWQYLVLLYIKPTSEHKRALVEFDRILKEKNRAYYDRVDIGTILKLRKTHFLGYTIAATHKKKKDNRFAPDGSMLY